MTATRAIAHDDIDRRFSAAGEGRYVLDVPDLGIVLDVDRVRRDRQATLRGELTIRCDLAGAQTIEGIVWSGEIVLSDSRGRDALIRTLGTRARRDDISWSLLIDELAMRVRAAERRGDPAVVLRDVPAPTVESSEILDIDGLRIPRRHPSILFGDGASGKSYLALYVAGELMRRGGHKVGLFDWELGPEDHRDRLGRLYGHDMPGIVYVRCSRPLVHEVDRLARVVHDHALSYAVLDSIGFATDGPPEAAECATAYIRALRQLRIGTLNLAHISKTGDTSEHRPFGSTFWHAGARATWFVKADAQPGQSSIALGLLNRKMNQGALAPSVGFDLAFSCERTTLTRIDVADVADLASRLSTYERVVSALRRGPQTVAALAADLDAKVDTIEKTLKRWIGKGQIVRLDAHDGTPTRYGLAELRRVT